MECRLLHGYDLDFRPNKWRWKFGPALNLLLFLLLVILLLFLVLLLGSLLLLLLSTDLLPGGLFVLQPLELCLLLGALVPPLTDVLPQLVVHLGLLLLVFGRRHGDE